MNKPRNKIVGFIILSFCLFGPHLYGQNEVKPNGYNIFYYPNGQISSEGMMKNSNPDGYWKTFYTTGVIKSEGNRVNFLLDSTWIFYSPTGDTSEIIHYVLGKKNGYYITYKFDQHKNISGNGYLFSKELYVNDKKEGPSYYFYPTGELKEIVYYEEGKREGTGYEYNRDSVIVTVNKFHNDILIERERINRTNKQGEKEGVWRSYYDNEKIKEEENYVNNQLEGLSKEFDRQGKLISVVKYAQGKIVRDTIALESDITFKEEYDSLDRLIFSGAYRENTPVGLHRWFNVEGNVIRSVMYSQEGVKLSDGIVDREGRKQDSWKYYYPSGAVKAIGQYNNNYRTGEWEFYYSSGKIEQKGTYYLGHPDGTWRWYYLNGKIRREEDFLQGNEDGQYVEYSKDGEILTNGTFIDGSKDGKWFYNVGDHTEEGKFVVGLRDGEWKYFFSNGVLAFEGNYIQGNPDGKHRFYYDNGMLREEQIYVMGIREGNWKKYDREGNIEIVITYKDNREYRINGIKIELPTKNIKLIR
ncbi:MAG TPA: hypothetical protein VE912_02835 [Bacteroidales bacterium]|nr:hypothetical protein [Bacteroidales bacterium]